MKILAKYQFKKLAPLFGSDLDGQNACKLKDSEVYRVDITKPRNLLFHKKYFSLLNLCYENQELYSDFEDLREEIIIKAGYFKEIKTLDGEIKKKALSISFAKMEQTDFEILYQKTIDVICKFIDVEEKDILNEVVNYI